MTKKSQPGLSLAQKILAAIDSINALEELKRLLKTTPDRRLLLPHKIRIHGREAQVALPLLAVFVIKDKLACLSLCLKMGFSIHQQIEIPIQSHETGKIEWIPISPLSLAIEYDKVKALNCFLENGFNPLEIMPGFESTALRKMLDQGALNLLDLPLMQPYLKKCEDWFPGPKTQSFLFSVPFLRFLSELSKPDAKPVSALLFCETVLFLLLKLKPNAENLNQAVGKHFNVLDLLNRIALLLAQSSVDRRELRILDRLDSELRKRGARTSSELLFKVSRDADYWTKIEGIENWILIHLTLNRGMDNCFIKEAKVTFNREETLPEKAARIAEEKAEYDRLMQSEARDELAVLLNFVPLDIYRYLPKFGVKLFAWALNSADARIIQRLIDKVGLNLMDSHQGQDFLLMAIEAGHCDGFLAFYLGLKPEGLLDFFESIKEKILALNDPVWALLVEYFLVTLRRPDAPLLERYPNLRVALQGIVPNAKNYESYMYLSICCEAQEVIFSALPLPPEHPVCHEDSVSSIEQEGVTHHDEVILNLSNENADTAGASIECLSVDAGSDTSDVRIVSPELVVARLPEQSAKSRSHIPKRRLLSVLDKPFPFVHYLNERPRDKPRDKPREEPSMATSLAGELTEREGGNTRTPPIQNDLKSASKHLVPLILAYSELKKTDESYEPSFFRQRLGRKLRETHLVEKFKWGTSSYLDQLRAHFGLSFELSCNRELTERLYSLYDFPELHVSNRQDAISDLMFAMIDSNYFSAESFLFASRNLAEAFFYVMLMHFLASREFNSELIIQVFHDIHAASQGDLAGLQEKRDRMIQFLLTHCAKVFDETNYRGENRIEQAIRSNRVQELDGYFHYGIQHQLMEEGRSEIDWFELAYQAQADEALSYLRLQYPEVSFFEGRSFDYAADMASGDYQVQYHPLVLVPAPF